MRNIKNKKGFTLSELLVVVAIIAVLVAISIPIFLGRTSAARAATCEANRRSLKAELSNDYMGGKTFDEETITEGTLINDYGENFDFETFCPEGGVISAQFIDGSFTVVCSWHNASFGNAETMQAIFTAFDAIHRANIDSGALIDSQSNAVKVAAALKNEGIDLEALEAVSWKYRQEGLFYWSTVNIQSLNRGDTVPIMRYNRNTGTYTVWIATIGRGSNNGYNYNTLGTSQWIAEAGIEGYEPSTSQSKEAQTYANALKIYNDLLKTMS